jgi:putative aminopeptidase FrvX
MSGAVGVPTRYIHSTAEIFSLKDLEASLRLLEGFIKAL